jgi:16S rRNA (guanine966-N2)-methyltransferase
VRIVSGSLRGRKLRSLRGMAVRPTADKVREAIFNILSFRVLGAVVLDLFAGTGALGIEALSRGAAFAAFTDRDTRSVSVIGQNISDLGLGDRTKIIRWDIAKNLNCIKKIRSDFDLVFMDPPYNCDLIVPTLFNLRESRALKPGSCIVAEHSDTESPPSDCPGYAIADRRKYGKTLVSFLDYMI